MAIVRILVPSYVGLLAVLYGFQTRVIFPGAATQGQPYAQVHPRPGSELVKLAAHGGDEVVAIYGQALQPDGRPDPDAASRPTLIFFYGNAMCVNYAFGEFDQFRRLGLNVIIPDYLGYGMSSGSASEKGTQATADAVYDYLVQTRKVEPGRLIAAGWSLGGAVAIDLAARRKVGGLIVFSTFTSGVDMARRMLPFVPVSLLLRHRFDSVHKIAQIHCPILIGHGRRDPIIPFHMAEQLAAKAGGPVSTLWIDRAEHNDFFDTGGRQIDQAIAAYLKNLPAEGR
jgi:pimeloyl-ACP methyl ester carboxylesterase